MATQVATQVGVGFSEQNDSQTAGREAARAALRQGGLDACDVLLVFSTSRHDPAELHAGLREVVGPQTRIIGGFSVGVITNHDLGYEGFQVGVAAFASETVKFDLFLEKGLANNELAVGQALGAVMAATTFEGEPNVILMMDSVNRTTGRFQLNMVTPFLDGLREHLSPEIRAAGAGLLGDMQCQPTWQWFDDRIDQQCALALVLSGAARMDEVVLHGCKPAGGYHTITASEGRTVLEIDQRPAVEVIGELLGADSGYSWEDYRFFVTLGINKGDKWGDYVEEDYANRLCGGVDKKRGGLIMFEPDLHPGTEVQLMRRSVDLEYIGERAGALLEKIEAEGRRPFFALYIDCAGRAGAYCGSEEEEAAEVQRVLGDKIPLLGIYSGVEIGRVGGDLQSLNWTGVLCIFSE